MLSEGGAKAWRSSWRPVVERWCGALAADAAVGRSSGAGRGGGWLALHFDASDRAWAEGLVGEVEV